MPPILTIAGLHEVGGAGRDHLAEVARARRVLAHRERHAGGLAQLRRDDSKSSGGQIGSSTQYGFDAFMAATGASASPGSQAQLVSTLIGMSRPGDVARRRDRLRRCARAA